MAFSYGTDEYINDVVARYSDSLIRSAFYILGNIHDAEDAAQNAFLKLIYRAQPFRDEGHEKAWLLRVTINNAKDMLRSHDNRSAPLEDWMADAGASGEDERLFLGEMFSELSENYREALFLYYSEGYQIGEIASILKIPAATVGTRLRRAREQLRNLMERGGEYV